MVVLSPAGPRSNSIGSRMFHHWAPCWTAWPRGCPLTMCIVYWYTTHMLKSYRHKGVKQFAETGSKAGIQPEHANRLRRLLSALDAATCPANMNAPGYALAPTQGRPGGALGRAGERELAAHVCVRGRGRDSRRLPGLPLGAKHAFQSIPSRRGPEGLPRRHDCEGGGQAPRGDAAESLPDTQRPRRHFSGDERAACQGDAVHVSRVLAEDAAQLRSFEGSEKQAAQNQTVSSPAAKELASTL